MKYERPELAIRILQVDKMTSSNALYSVFGSPQQKIGDFTQTKLEGF